MKVVIRPIRYTSNVVAMREWAVRLGMTPLLDTDGWIVLGAGSGRLAIHEVAPGDALDGTTTLAVETDDLDALERHWQQAGMSTRRTDEHGVPLLLAATPFGGEIAAGDLSPESHAARERDLVIMPMLALEDVTAGAEWFARWGLRRRITSESGGWVDLEIEHDGGLVALHATGNLEADPPAQTLSDAQTGMREVAVWLSFEHPDVDALLERLRAAGLDDARVHDEAYNRTLITITPDGDEVWINGEMADLYGYRRD